jgi:hypothetical protein
MGWYEEPKRKRKRWQHPRVDDYDGCSDGLAQSTTSRPRPQPSTPSPRLQAILSRFEQVTQNCSGWQALCPGHDDTNPSLSIGEGKDGRVVVCCHAGCHVDDVLYPVGLKVADLMPDSSFEVAWYPYVDEAGTELYQIVRKFPKAFFVRAADGTPSIKGVRRVLYRLPEMLRDKKLVVYVCEGEKDADRLAGLGLTATTCPFGAKAWQPEFNESLRDHKVALIPDNDDVGKSRVQEIARQLVGIATWVKIVTLPDVPEKGDVSDWLDLGHTKEDLVALMLKTPVEKEIQAEARIEEPNKVIKIIKIDPPTLHDNALLGIPGDFIKSVQDYTEATPAAILGHFLPAAGCYAGPRVFVYAGGKQPARLHICVVGPSNAARKGTSFTPVDSLFRLVDPGFWPAQRDSGLSSGEGVIVRVSDIRTKNPKTGKWDIEPVDRRLYVLEEEFSRVLANMKREGNVLSQIIRQAYDNGDLSTMTITPRRVTGAHISIITHIGPEELVLRLGQIEMANGFLNRFLIFYVRSDRLLSQTTPIPISVFGRFAKKIKPIGNQSERCVSLSTNAQLRWAKLYPSLREDLPGLLGAITARRSSQLLRLALVYAVLDRSQHIEVDHLQAAEAVIDYCRESVQILFGDSSGDALADKILDLLSSGAMTKTDLNCHLTPWEKSQADQKLESLRVAGRVRAKKTQGHGPGRPSTVWERVS